MALNQAKGKTDLKSDLSGVQGQGFQAGGLQQTDTSGLIGLAGQVQQQGTAMLTNSIGQFGDIAVKGIADYSLQKLEDEQHSNIEEFLDSRKNPQRVQEALENIGGLETASESLWAKFGEGTTVNDINHVTAAQERELQTYQRAVQQGVMSREELEMRVLETTRKAIRRTPGLSDALMGHAEKVLSLSGVRMLKDPEAPEDAMAKAHATLEKMALKYDVYFDPRNPNYTEMNAGVQRKMQQLNDYNALKQYDDAGNIMTHQQAKAFVQGGGMSAVVNASLSETVATLTDVFNGEGDFAQKLIVAETVVKARELQETTKLRNQGILQTPEGQEGLQTVKDGLADFLRIAREKGSGASAAEAIKNQLGVVQATQELDVAKMFNVAAANVIKGIDPVIMSRWIQKAGDANMFKLISAMVTKTQSGYVEAGFTQKNAEAGVHDNTAVFRELVKSGDKPAETTAASRTIVEGLENLKAKDPAAVLEFLDSHLQELGKSEMRNALRDKTVPIGAISDNTRLADEYMRQALNMKRTLVDKRDGTLGSITGLSDPAKVHAEILPDGRIRYVSEDLELETKLNDKIAKRYNHAIAALANLSGSTVKETSKAFYSRNKDAFDIEQSSFDKAFGTDKGEPQGKKIDRKRIDELVQSEASSVGLDPKIVQAIIKQESAGNQAAVSNKGAQGLMQLMPATARELGVNPNDPADNIKGGVRYFKQQLDRFGTIELALAAYNAGPGAVQKYGGIPPFPETQDYVKKIMANLNN